MAPKIVALSGLIIVVACGGSSGKRAPTLGATGGSDGMAGHTGSAAPFDAGASDAPAGSPSGTGGTHGSTGGQAGGQVDGGASGGGAGAPPTGAGGLAGGLDPQGSLLLPPHCEPRGRSESGTSCMLSAFCDSFPHVTSCQRLTSGRWRCTSEPGHQDRIYEIEGAEGVQACAVATGLSSKEQLKLGDDSCVPTAESTADGYCMTEMVCGPMIEVDFAPAVRARLARYGSSECVQRMDVPAIDCGFRFRGVTVRPDLSVWSSSLSCRPWLELCMSTTAPNFSGPPTCVVTRAVSSTEGCERHELCTNLPPSRLGPGLPALETRYVNCEPEAGGGARCACSGRDSGFQFQVSAPPDDGLCSAFSTSCLPTADIEVTGEVTCQQESATLNGNGCEADLTCTYPATVDGRAIVGKGRLVVMCGRRDGGSPWSCSCASDQATATFTLGATGATSAQACARAPQECRQRIPVRVGPYGPFVPPPDPIF